MRTHTGENYHTCPLVTCGKRFAHENKLRHHMQTAHREGKEEEERLARKGKEKGMEKEKKKRRRRRMRTRDGKM